MKFNICENTENLMCRNIKMRLQEDAARAHLYLSSLFSHWMLTRCAIRDLPVSDCRYNMPRTNHGTSCTEMGVQDPSAERSNYLPSCIDSLPPSEVRNRERHIHIIILYILHRHGEIYSKLQATKLTVPSSHVQIQYIIYPRSQMQMLRCTLRPGSHTALAMSFRGSYWSWICVHLKIYGHTVLVL